ncbi:hypothetical protein ACFU6I_04225 [Streptomyces sp. NPDC057486]|uniref:hypothetical protein n=1 Tax=Streptomyces sp. NPDC057486 TaxID=3346145 RepID=UPI00368FBF0A
MDSRRADEDDDPGEQMRAHETLERTVEACGEVDWDIIDDLIRRQNERDALKSKREKIKGRLEAAYGKLSAASGTPSSEPSKL